MIKRRDLNGMALGTAAATMLVSLYNEILHNQHLWKSGELEKVEGEIRMSTDPKMDVLLISLFEKVSEEDGTRGNLSELGGKRTLKRSEELLYLIGRRGTNKCVEFVVSQAASKYPVIRAAVVDALGSAILANPQHERVMARVVPLLRDADPDVSGRTLSGFLRILADEHVVTSSTLASALTAAHDAAKPGVRVANGYYDLKERFGEAIRAYKAHLTTHQQSATPHD